MDLAYSLAQTQEALLAEDTSRTSKRWNAKPYVHEGLMGASPTAKQFEDRPKQADRVDSLRAQRRAHGECFKCGEKYSPGHKCPQTVQLHVLEELMEALQLTEVPDSESDSEEETPQITVPKNTDADACMKLSVHAAT